MFSLSGGAAVGSGDEGAALCMLYIGSAVYERLWERFGHAARQLAVILVGGWMAGAY